MVSRRMRRTGKSKNLAAACSRKAGAAGIAFLLGAIAARAYGC